MSLTIWPWIFQIVISSGSRVSQPSGPGGSASEPAVSAARWAARLASRRASLVGIPAAGDLAVRHLADEIEDRGGDPAMFERGDDGGYLLAVLGHAWLRAARHTPGAMRARTV